MATSNAGRPVYNLCVKARLRTTYTGLDRIYYAQFNVSRPYLSHSVVAAHAYLSMSLANEACTLRTQP
jgi:hypothetical protein